MLSPNSQVEVDNNEDERVDEEADEFTKPIIILERDKSGERQSERATTSHT